MDLGVRPTVFSYALPLAGCMMVGKLTYLSEPLLSVFKVETHPLTRWYEVWMQPCLGCGGACQLQRALGWWHVGRGMVGDRACQAHS